MKISAPAVFAFLLVGILPASAAGQLSSSVASVVAQVRQYRKAHEPQIVHELTDLLSIPNVANDEQNIGRNADKLVAMLSERGFETRLLPIPGRGPVVLGNLRTPGATRTITFYSHYDGQPVGGDWKVTKPFVPVLLTSSADAGGQPIPFPGASTPYQDNWRIYARSSSDDKSPIVALLTALDALRASKIPLTSNLQVLFEGEEEGGSPHLERVLMANQSLLAKDLLIFADGPVDQSGLPLICFGNRGIVDVSITVYGPLHQLHSGHYGNWAPNPAQRLVALLASMKDDRGHVLIDGFYDDVSPLSDIEKRALASAPPNDADLLRKFGLAQPETVGLRQVEAIEQPSLNIDGLQSGWVGAQSKTIIPENATASIDMRLVKNISIDSQFQRLLAHVRKQGFHVTTMEPTAGEREKYSKIARVTMGPSYPASRTSMDLPVSRALVGVVEQGEGRVVELPTMGGSGPTYIFERLGIPFIVLPMVNFDNNQHSADENLRVGNLWYGVEVYAAVLAGLRW